jgi:hypothetical protein
VLHRRLVVDATAESLSLNEYCVQRLGGPDLRVSGLVRLNAGDHSLEHVVARFVGERCQSNELQISETRFEHDIGGNLLARVGPVAARQHRAERVCRISALLDPGDFR